MVINPFFVIFFTYLFSSCYAFLSIYNSGGFWNLGRFFVIDDSVLLQAALVQMAVFLFVFSIYRLSIEKNFFKVNLFYKNVYGYFLIIITISFIVFNQVSGFGLAGNYALESNTNPVNYIFVILKPDLLFVIVAPFLISNRLFWVACVLFSVSMILRGWMGWVLILFIVISVRFYPIKIKPSYVVLFLIGILLLPFLDVLKWSFRTGLSIYEVFNIVLELNPFEVFPIVLESVVERFQHLSYSTLALQNRDLLLEELFTGNISLPFQAGILNSILCSLFNNCALDLNTYMAYSLIDGGSNEVTWNLDSGVDGWLLILGWISPLYIFLFSILIFLFVALFKRNSGNAGLLLFFCFFMVYFFNSWMTPFFDFVLYFLVLNFIRRVRFGRI